jgi:hypothetical protein
MKKKVVVAAIAGSAVLFGGWALAASSAQAHGGDHGRGQHKSHGHASHKAHKGPMRMQHRGHTATGHAHKVSSAVRGSAKSIHQHKH